VKGRPGLDELDQAAEERGLQDTGVRGHPELARPRLKLFAAKRALGKETVGRFSGEVANSDPDL